MILMQKNEKAIINTLPIINRQKKSIRITFWFKAKISIKEFSFDQIEELMCIKYKQNKCVEARVSIEDR